MESVIKTACNLTYPNDFDIFRKSLISNFNTLCKKLKAASVVKDEYGLRDQKIITIDPNIIKEDMIELRRIIIILSCITEIGEYNCSDVSENVEIFNPDIENWNLYYSFNWSSHS